MESRKSLLVSSDNSPELATIIEEIVHMYNYVNTVVKEFSTHRALFTYLCKIGPVNFSGTYTTPTETP